MATNIAIFRINYKSDFILTLNSDAGWMTPFCIKFWTGAPSQAFFAQWDGTTYTHCSYDPSEPTKLIVQFDDHHLPIGDLKFQIAYHFTVADFPTSVEDEVINQASVIIEVDDAPAQVMLDFNGETAPEIEFSLPAYANEAQRIANEEARIAAEQQRIANEDARIQAEEIRQQNEQQRIDHETDRVNEFATLKSQSQAATRDANDAADLANQKAQLAADKAALAGAAATLANAKAQLAADKAALADAAATLANDKAALAQQKAEYAQTQGDYAKAQGDYAKNQGNYAKEQGDIAQTDHERAEADHGIAVDDHTQAGNDHTRAEADHGIAVDDHTQAGNDHTRAESDHGIAADDHTQAGNDHTRAESDHGIAVDDHTQAGNDHTRAESDHTRAESDHAAVEVYVDSLGAFDISAYHATGGVLAKYADLTAALGTNGANIPEAIRKGGMSVKFVLSSDNKYVQFRYMGTETTGNPNPFLDTANWQGVDNAPTAGSKNLVTSGGVKEENNKLNTRIWKLEEVLNSDYAREGLFVADADGNVVAKITRDGIQAVDFIDKNGVSLPDGKVDKVQGKQLSTNDFTDDDKDIISYLKQFKDSFYITDSNGYVLFKANGNGINYVGKNSGGGDSTIVDDGYKQSDIVYNMYYGRSLSYHGTCAPEDSRYTNLAFKLSSYGTPESMLLNVTSDIIDNQTAMDNLFLGFREAPASNNIILANRALTMFLKQQNGIDDGWKDEANLEPNYQYQFVGCNPGEVATWGELADSDGLYYKRLLASVRYAKQFADEMGKTFSVGCICYAQAEDTYSGAIPKQRYDCVWVLASKLNVDIKAITGQTNDIFFITYQVASYDSHPYINNAYGDLAIWLNDEAAPVDYVLDETAAAKMPAGYPLIHRKQIQAGPIMCALDYRAVASGGDDHIHATQGSYHAMAAQYAIQMKACMYDQKPLKPIHVESYTITPWNNKYIVRLKMYVPVKPLVVDTEHRNLYSARATSPNLGFAMLNGSNVDIIESVEVVRGEEIKIITTENPSGKTLHYAKDGWEHGGNIRDSRDIVYNDSTIGDYYMYNWCPIFKLDL